MSVGIDRDKLSGSLLDIQKRLEDLKIRCKSDPENADEILADALEALKKLSNEKRMQDDEGSILEEGMTESEDEFRFLAESIPHLVWSARSDGVSDYYNSRFLSYLGKTLDQMHGWTWMETLHPDDRQRSLDAWKEAFTTGKEYRIEYRIGRAS